MKDCHTTAIVMVLQSAAKRLEFAGNGITPAQVLAQEIQLAHEGIQRAIKMIRLVTKSEVKPL